MSKLLTIFSILLLSFSVLANAKNNTHPFVGKRWFNFDGGNQTQLSIRIHKNGKTVITAYGSVSSDIVYRGNYKRYLPIYDGENYYTIVGKNAIAMLDNNMNVMSDCRGDEKLCVVELSKEN